MSRFETDAISNTVASSSRRPPRPDAGIGDDALNRGLDPQELLEREYTEWNERIDKEVKAVADGLKGLLDTADFGTNPSPHHPPIQAMQLKLRTSTLIRSAQNLRDMAHELKLLLLLSDEAGTVRSRDAELKLIRDETKRTRQQVVLEAQKLLSGEDEEGGERQGEQESSNDHGETDPHGPDTVGDDEQNGHASKAEKVDEMEGTPKASDPPDEDMELDEDDDFEEVS